MTTRTTTAYELGRNDGLEWDLNGFRDRVHLESEKEGWDDATLNAVGSDEMGAYLGVRIYWSEVMTKKGARALAAYNRGAHAGALEQWDRIHK